MVDGHLPLSVRWSLGTWGLLCRVADTVADALCRIADAVADELCRVADTVADELCSVADAVADVLCHVAVGVADRVAARSRTLRGNPSRGTPSCVSSFAGVVTCSHAVIRDPGSPTLTMVPGLFESVLVGCRVTGRCLMKLRPHAESCLPCWSLCDSQRCRGLVAPASSCQLVLRRTVKAVSEVSTVAALSPRLPFQEGRRLRYVSVRTLPIGIGRVDNSEVRRRAPLFVWYACAPM